MIIIRVNGKPAPQGSKTRNRAGAVYESSAALRPWRAAVRTETQRTLAELASAHEGDPNPEPPFTPTDAVEASILFLFNRPASHYRTGRNAHLLRDSAPTRPVGKKNDIDKLTRAVLDGVTEGGALADDGQVVDAPVSVDYCQPGEVPGCLIRLELATVTPLVSRVLFGDRSALLAIDHYGVPAELVLGGRAPGLYVAGNRIT